MDLTGKLSALRAQRDQALINLGAIGGQMSLCEELIAEGKEAPCETSPGDSSSQAS